MNEQRKRQRMKNVRDFVACTICGGAWCTNVPSVPPAQGHECRLKLFEVQKKRFYIKSGRLQKSRVGRKRLQL